MASEGESFPALGKLADLPEVERRGILSPRRDERAIGVHGPPDLQPDLQRIMLRELFAQATNSTSEDYRDIPAFQQLRGSPSFAQYLNTCLYFGVRFADGRISNPCHNPRPLSHKDCNEPVVGLPPPPICTGDWPDFARTVERFRSEIVPGDRIEPVRKALLFLDDPISAMNSSDARSGDDHRTSFELWLRGLYREPEEESSFREIAAGLLRWAQSRYGFYTSLEMKAEKQAWVTNWINAPWKEGCWSVNNPLSARCAIVDFYWLARILRADVSPGGVVTYCSYSWLHYLAMMEAPGQERGRANEDVLRWEEVLRSVFAYACDLIQNAVDKAGDCLDERYNSSFAGSAASWRAVYDQELEEIRTQRSERGGDSGPSTTAKPGSTQCEESERTRGWSRRVWTGEDVDNLVGLAFSGGGIRSATFNLGVLQHLQELDLLRKVDYLSTVSGGGYIGAWLVGNVRRTRYWLSRMTSWDESIAYLRSYSDYLAPHTGILSPDTWTVAVTWIRNAFLIQLTAFAWLAFLLVSVICIKPLFDWIGDFNSVGGGTAQILLLVSVILISLLLVFYLGQPPGLVKWARSTFGKYAEVTKSAGPATIAICTTWIASFLTAGLLWRQALGFPLPDAASFSWIFQHAGSQWPWYLSGALAAGLGFIAFFSFQKTISLIRRFVFASLIAFGGTLLSYLTFCGLLRFYVQLSSAGGESDSGSWYAYVFGPGLTIAAIALSVFVFVGLIGRNAEDQTREWWTRYGALVAMIGAGTLVLGLAAIFAPLWVYGFANLDWWKSVKAGTAMAWVGSVISGVLAGRSTSTGKEGESSNVMQWVARIGGLLFIVGALLLASSAIYYVIGDMLVDQFEPLKNYWHNLSELVRFQPALPGAGMTTQLELIAVLLFLLACLFSGRFDLNTFGLNQFYRNRLVRCYLGATRWQPGKRHPNFFTGFDNCDDLKLKSLSFSNQEFCGEPFRGPFPIVNCTLNLGGSSDLTIKTRQSASFTLTPLFCGALRKKVGYQRTRDFYGGDLMLGQAISVSGAAASPNMGFNTSPLVSILLTLFNVRLGWWFPNPAKNTRSTTLSAFYLLRELFGLANENGTFVSVSDGGHFENLGIYELVRRRARVIIAADSECDPQLAFGSLGNVIRICETDFGAKIDLDVSSIRRQEESGLSHSHCAVGKITYCNGALGYLIYIKSSITGDEDVGVAQYRSEHPTFPHETTADQFFTEDQFEAYRRLGRHIAARTFRGAGSTPEPFAMAGTLFDLWVPASVSSESFVDNANTFDKLWDRFRQDPDLKALFLEFVGSADASAASELTAKEICTCMELMQLMENAFLDLRLDDFWDHPDNRGWVVFFTMCARSPKFREVWSQVSQTYGIRFEYFCKQRLGLKRPVSIRV